MVKKTSTLDSKASSKKADSASSEKKKKVKRPGTKFGAKKGKQFEREIATALGHIFPDAQRMLEYQGSNVIGVDLENTDVFRFQCKCTANYKNPSAIFEIREKGPHVPVLVTKANNRPPMAVLPFEEFVTLLERAYGHRERLINPYQQERVLPQRPVEVVKSLHLSAALPEIPEAQYRDLPPPMLEQAKVEETKVVSSFSSSFL